MPGGPGGANRPYYFGFANGNPVNNCGPGANQNCMAFSFSPQVLCNCAGFPAGGSNDCGADSTVQSAIAAAGAYVWGASQTQFTMGIAGFVSDTNVADVWTIDQEKNLVMIQNGL